jgi:small conductance mechanosensitive channel
MDPTTMENMTGTVIAMVTTYGLRVLGAVAILIVGRIVSGVLSGGVRRAMQKAGVDEALVRFGGTLVGWAIMVFAVIAALNQFGVQATSFVAVLGAAGLAVGLALQGSLANFAAGVLILLFRPFKIGDFVDAGGSTGTVNDISILTTVLTDLVTRHPKVLKDPAPTVEVVALVDSSVNFVVRPWVATPDYWSTYFELTRGIKEALDRNGISIPFPQRDVHVFQAQRAQE